MAFQNYSDTPKYVRHGNYGSLNEDVVYNLACQIKVWKPTGNDWFNVPSIESDACTTLNEVISIDIKNSYKQLISTANIKIPRGAIISKVRKYTKKVSTGNKSGQDSESILSNASEDGQLVTDEMLTYEDGGSVMPIRAFRSDDVDYGAILVTRHESDRVATDADFSIGSRIQIKVGYVTDVFDDRGNIVETAFDRLEKIRVTDNPPELRLVFTGFITGCSAASPLEIECENMACLLKKISCPRIVAKGNMTVNDFLKSGGRYDLLKDTGLALSPITEEVSINIGSTNVDSNVTVADILETWNKKGGIMAFVEPDGKHIRVGMASYVGTGGVKDMNGNKKYATYSDTNQLYIAQFDWDVAADDLKIIHSNKKYLAVRAIGYVKNGASEPKRITLTIKPKFDSVTDFDVIDNEGETEDDVDFNVLNETVATPKVGKLKKNGTRAKIKKPGVVTHKKEVNQVNLDKHTVVTFYSDKNPTTRQQLLEDAQRYWKSYSPNGISGSVTFFGDVEVNVADTIGLIDPTRPEIDGYYIVESVDIDFGVGGYRKKVKLPNRVQKFKQKVKIIR